MPWLSAAPPGAHSGSSIGAAGNWIELQSTLSEFRSQVFFSDMTNKQFLCFHI